jgi:biopolymer transport protein ExbB
MIEVFRKLESIGGRADVGLLSGGIWVALLTTAFGLLIAIPTLIAHHYFSDQVSERSEDLQFLISRLNVYTGAALSTFSKENTENLYEAISAT